MTCPQTPMSTDESPTSGDSTLSGASVAGQGEQCLLATIADELYALDLSSIREVLRSSDKEIAPGAPPFVAGLMSLRGEIITVIDAGCLLGVRQHRDQAPEPRIVVIEGASEVVGIQVDNLREVIEYDPEAIQRPQLMANSAGYDYIKGVFSWAEDELVIVLDVDALCTEKTGTVAAEHRV